MLYFVIKLHKDMYTKNKENSNFVFWVCRNRTCKVTAISHEEWESLIEVNRNHDHPSDVATLKAEKLVSDMKNQALKSFGNVKICRQ